MQFNKNESISSKRIDQLYELLKRLNLDKTTPVWTDQIDLSKIHIINEALTHTSANSSINHERLEFLGDAVLRLAASEFIDRKFPGMTVGERSSLRAQLVSDRWLAKVGHSICINEIINIGRSAASDKSALGTLEAESTEALIGALYECLRSLDPIHSWLTPFWEEEAMEVLKDPNKRNSKSALQEWSQSNNLNIPEYISEERSKKHGDPYRFFCEVRLEGKALAQGWGGSRQDSEKESARIAMEKLNKQDQTAEEN